MILEKLETDTVVGDGGTIFELERRGYISAGPFTPQVVIEHPEAVKQLHIDFARAGSEVIQALTYYAHEEKLKVVGLGGSLKEINANAVRIAKDVAIEYSVIVAGNLCNTWVFDPDSPSTFKEARRQFDEQIKYQLEHEPDFFIAETFGYLEEAKIALEAIMAVNKPSMITLGFKLDDKTLDGIGLEDAFKTLEDSGADIVGINCFRDPQMTLPLIMRLKKAVSCFSAAQPVAYRCSQEKPYFQIQEFNGHIAFPLELDPFTLSRFEMAKYAIDAKEIGIDFIGACCGAGPHHIRAMAEALGRTVPNSKYSPDLKLHTIIGNESHIKEKNARILRQQRHGRPKHSSS